MPFKKILLDGDVAGGSGTLTQKNMDSSDVAISATGDNQAALNLASITGVASIYYELLVKVISPANAEIRVVGNIENPGHTVLETFEFRFAATGSGDIFATTSLIVGRDASPATGNYHLNITTLTLGTGTVTVLLRRLIAVQA